MTRKKIFLLAVAAIAAGTLKAQYVSGEDPTTPTDPPRFRINSVRLSAGALNFSTGGAPYDRMLSHSPHQTTLRALDAGYNWYGGGSYSFNTSFAPFIGIGFQPYNKERKEYNPLREFYAGVGIVRGSESISGDKETKVGTDTIVRSFIHYEEQVRSVFAHASYQFRTDPNRRISLHIGFGMAFGYSYSSDLVRSQHTDSLVSVTVGNTQQLFPLNNNYMHDARSYANSRCTSVKVFVPWGFDLRLSKSRPVLSNLRLSFEMQTGLLMQNFARGENTTSDYASTSIGVKYCLR